MRAFGAVCRGGLIVLLLATGCQSGGSVRAHVPGRAMLRIDGEMNPAVKPPSCRVHGGTPPVRSAAPVWTGRAQRDSRLDSLGIGRLSVRVNVSADRGAISKYQRLARASTPSHGPQPPRRQRVGDDRRSGQRLSTSGAGVWLCDRAVGFRRRAARLQRHIDHRPRTAVVVPDLMRVEDRSAAGLTCVAADESRY